MAATLTAYNAALKRIWTQDHLEEQLYQGTDLLSRIEKTTNYKVGETARVPLHVSRNGGYTVLPAGGGNLNTAGNQGLNKAEFNYTNHHQQIAIQGDAIDGTSSSALSVAQVVDTEVSGALQDLRREIQRQLFQNGDALIAQCGTTTASTTVQLNTTSGGNAAVRGWLFVGLPIDIGTTGSEASVASNRSITAVDDVNATITISGAAVTTSSSHYVSVHAARSGTTSYESNGLRNLVSTTAVVGGLDPANEPTWKAANVDTTSQALTLSLLLQQDQKVHQKTGRKADTVVMGLKQERKFYELLQQQVRFSGDGNISAGSSDNPRWNNSDIIVDPDCPDEDVYFLQLKHLFNVAIDKPYWQNKVTGGEILSWVQGTDSYGAKLTYRYQLATNRRNGFARLGGLT